MIALIRSSSVRAASRLAFFVPAGVEDFPAAGPPNAFTGARPETYLAAPPFPGLFAGNRRARTEVDLGMIVVSSSYSVSCQRLCQRVSSPRLPSLVFSL